MEPTRFALVKVPAGRLLSGPQGGVHVVDNYRRHASSQSHGSPFDFFTTVNRPPVIIDFSTNSPVVQGETFEIQATFTDSDSLSRVAHGDRRLGRWHDQPRLMSLRMAPRRSPRITFTTQGGFYNVTVTIIDGADSTVFTTSDPLTAEVAGVSLQDGVLQVVGTDGNDNITVSSINGLLQVVTGFTTCGIKTSP